MMINTFIKQQISDNEFQSFKELIHPTMVAYYYVRSSKKSVTIDTINKIDHNLIVLKPYLEEYLDLKEVSLGKSRLLFSEEEKIETLKEMESLYHTLKKEGVTY